MAQWDGERDEFEGEEYQTAHQSLHDEDTDWDGAEDETYHTEEEELALADEDERLPWLESSDYEDEERTGGFNPTLLLLLLIPVAAILIGGAWWYFSQRPDPGMVADGSTIQAPEGDYKERPEDPGGKEFAGTGDTSFAVGEGQTREGRLAEGNAPRPSVTTATPEDAGTGSDTASSSDDNANASASGGVGVQVGAYSTKAGAEAGWQRLTSQTEALSGLRHRVVQGQVDIGTVYRLQAVAGDRAAANALCSRLRSDGIDCAVK